MKFLDILLGRTKPVKSKLEKLFAISTAFLTLTVKLDLKPTGKAGIVFKPVTSSEFDQLEKELRELLDIGSRATQTKVSIERDSYGFQWVVLQDDDFEDLVATLHVVSLTLQEHGFGDQLLAAVFKFEEDGKPVYWIYNYKRGSFYPEVPKPQRERERDNASELRLSAAMAKELPIEPELERWYPLWGIPL